MKTNEKTNNQEKGIALIYLRVSTDKQAEKGIAIPTQQEECLVYAREQGYVCDIEKDVYVDKGESARTVDRPALLEMMARCENDDSVGAVVVYDISRLARNRIDFAFLKQALNKRSIKLVSVTEAIDDSPEGQMMEGILSSVAEFFSLQSARKVKANMVKRVRDGYWPSYARYGYKNKQEKVSTGKVRSWVELDPIEAKWVLHAFELFATGNYTTRSLTNKLNAEQMPIRQRKNGSNKAAVNFIQAMLRDEFYIGIIDWGGVVNPNGKHELFLDKALFDKVQVILDSRTADGLRNRRLHSIFKGPAYCQECGSRITAEEQTSSSGVVHRYLRCLKSRGGCTISCSQSYGVESECIEQIKKVIKNVRISVAAAQKLNVRIKELFSGEQKIYESARKAIVGKLDDLMRRKKNLVLKFIDAQERSATDVELYEIVKKDLEQEESVLRTDLATTESRLAGVVRTVEIALSLAASCSFAFEKAKEPALQALLLRTLFKRIEIRDKQIAKVYLNEPLEYLCKGKIIKNTQFGLDLVGGVCLKKSEPISSKIPNFVRAERVAALN